MENTKQEAYLTMTRMTNSDTMAIEIRGDGKRDVITLPLADFARVITGQVLKVEVEEKESPRIGGRRQFA